MGLIDFFCLFCLVANLTRPRATRWTVPNVPNSEQSLTLGQTPPGADSWRSWQLLEFPQSGPTWNERNGRCSW